MSTAGWAPVTTSDIKIICGQNQFRSYQVSWLLVSGDNVTISELEMLQNMFQILEWIWYFLQLGINEKPCPMLHLTPYNPCNTVMPACGHDLIVIATFQKHDDMVMLLALLPALSPAFGEFPSQKTSNGEFCFSLLFAGTSCWMNSRVCLWWRHYNGC